MSQVENIHTNIFWASNRMQFVPTVRQFWNSQTRNFYKHLSPKPRMRRGNCALEKLFYCIRTEEYSIKMLSWGWTHHDYSLGTQQRRLLKTDVIIKPLILDKSSEYFCYLIVDHGDFCSSSYTGSSTCFVLYFFYLFVCVLTYLLTT